MDHKLQSLYHNFRDSLSSPQSGDIGGRRYSLDFSTDLENWFEIIEEEIADGDSMSYTDPQLPAGPTTLFYRVREIN